MLRRLDAVLESTKQAVLERKKFLDTHGVAEQDGALRMAAGQAFYNTSESTLEKLKTSTAGQRLRDDFIVLVGGAPLNEEFGKAVGADAYCRDAGIAVETAKTLIAARRAAAAA